MDTGSTKQLEDICRQQSSQHSRRNIFSNMETCAISIQSCWYHFKRNWAFNILTFHIVVEGTTQVFTGAIKLAYNRGQQHQTHQSYCIMQKIPQLQTSKRQQTNNHSVHTSSWPGSNLLCEDGTTNFLCTRNEGSDGTIRGFSNQFSQDTASIHR